MTTIKLLAAAAALTTLPTQAGAVVSILTPLNLTTATYTQTFNTLSSTGESSTLPTGFQIAETGTAATVDGAYNVSTGTSTAGDVYSFGAAGAADRALGTLLSGTNAPSFGAVFTNGLGSAITALTFAFTGEQWRSVAGAADRLDFQYRLTGGNIDTGTWIDVNALDILALVTASTGAIDGNAAANRAAYNATIAGLNIAAGQSFAFRFVDVDFSPGADAGLALDDLTLTATTAQVAAVPEPATWATMIAGFALLGGALRRRAARPALA